MFLGGNGGYSFRRLAENIFGGFGGYLPHLRKKSAKQYLQPSINDDILVLSEWNIN